MRKIKGFKLNLKIKEIQRRAKKAKIDLVEAGCAQDAELTALLTTFTGRTKPSVVFESFTAETHSALAPVPGLAYSLAITTLGAEVDDYVQQVAIEKPARGPLLKIIGETALDDAARFVLNLVEDEAREERCELSPIQSLTDPAALRTIAEKLEAHKINVEADDNGFKPAHSSAFSISWLSRAKTKSR